jgi:hypothetical protein
MITATILLIPLFGVHFLVTLVRPQTDDCLAEQVYYYFFYMMDGLQGAVVALLYCYLNKGVCIHYPRQYAVLLRSCLIFSLFSRAKILDFWKVFSCRSFATHS